MAARAATKRGFVRATTQYEEKEIVDEGDLCTKQQFKSRMRKRPEYKDKDSVDMSDEFDGLLAAASSDNENSDGERCIVIDRKKKKRRVRGTRRERGVRAARDLSKERHAGLEKQFMAVPPRRTGSYQSAPSECGTGTAAPTTPSRLKRSGSSQGSAPPIAKLSPGNLALHALVDGVVSDEDDASAGSIAREVPEPRRDEKPAKKRMIAKYSDVREGAGSSNPGRLTPAALIKAKDELVEKMEEGLKNYDNMIKELRRADGKLEDHRRDALETSTQTVIDNLKAAQNKVRYVVQEVNGMRDQSKLSDVSTSATIVVPEYTDVITTCHEQLDAIKLLSGKDRKCRISAMNKQRFSRIKIEKELLRGGFKQGLAKVMSEHLFEYVEATKPVDKRMQEEDADDDDEAPQKPPPPPDVSPILVGKVDLDGPFNADMPTLWQKPEGVMFDCMQALTAKLAEKPGDKCAKLETELRKKSWKGAVTRVLLASEVELPADLGGELLKPDMIGSAPWMFMCLRSACRMGPLAWPLPGYGTLMTALDHDMVVMLFDVHALLEVGITLESVASYLETAAAHDSQLQYACVVVVKKGVVLWVPYGKYPMPLFWMGNDSMKVEPVASGLALPILRTSFADACPKAAMKAVMTVNRVHLDKNRGKELYDSRRTRIEEFNSELACMKD